MSARVLMVQVEPGPTTTLGSCRNRHPAFGRLGMIATVDAAGLSLGVIKAEALRAARRCFVEDRPLVRT